jgi:hypothetical protein
MVRPSFDFLINSPEMGNEILPFVFSFSLPTQQKPNFSSMSLCWEGLTLTQPKNQNLTLMSVQIIPYPNDY